MSQQESIFRQNLKKGLFLHFSEHVSVFYTRVTYNIEILDAFLVFLRHL